ncbi:MAG: tRNA pseudouridine(55) synthase TruB [Clostridiales Family XIII bacterium]|jgi:tRNA pseudouridine55 synthase|nr:tRNA pseudouridine(55) synthase TruB [Clostridiales Family XIII bacterium]
MTQNGIIVFNKPQGMTSHDAVNIIRRLTGVRKVGHSGTLDPMATGVLPIFIGKATRVIEFADKDEVKCYRCVMKLGYESDTQDIWGAVRRTFPENRSLPDRAEIERIIASFEGDIVQRTPIYSAVKYKGRKLYDYARAGEVLPEEALKEREVNIKHIIVNKIDQDAGTVDFTVSCSRGTYVRTICSDIGRALGCGGVMSGLTRTRSGGFRIEDGYSPDELSEMRERNMPLPILPIDAAIKGLPKTALDAPGAAKFATGISVQRCADVPTGYIRVYDADGFIGIGKVDGALIKPYKVITAASVEIEEAKREL